MSKKSEEIMIRYDNAHRKLYRALVEGKIGIITERMDKTIAQKNLELAVKLEEYEAAQIFKNYIDLL